MRYTRQRWGGALLALAASLLLACDHDALDPSAVRGHYRLVSVNGNPVPYPQGVGGPVGGSLTLTWPGIAERRITYRVGEAQALQELVATGKYSVNGSRLELELMERLPNGQKLGYVWRPRATIVGDTITITYPDPADGPDIVEKYVR